MSFLTSVFLVLNCMGFALFCLDKAQAMMGWWRTAETTLLAAVALGPFGCAVAMLLCSHKVTRWKFWLAVCLFSVSHLVLQWKTMISAQLWATLPLELGILLVILFCSPSIARRASRGSVSARSSSPNPRGIQQNYWSNRRYYQ
eukprot:RCo008938